MSLATQSTSSSNAADGKPQNSGAELNQPTTTVEQNGTMTEPSQPGSTPPMFVNSEPMREEQVQNAVKFLSHPKVRGSPVIYRRSFLEKKGLTKEEIDEAFRRVPDSAPSMQTTSVSQDGQLKTPSNVPQQPLIQAIKPAAAPTSAIATLRSQFRWYHAILAIGVLTTSGAGIAVIIKNCVGPRVKSWIRKVVIDDVDPVKKADAKPTLAEEAAAAAKAAAAAAADVAKASQEIMTSKGEERRYYQEVMNLLDMQVQEMKSMTIAIRRLEGQTNAPGRIPLSEQDHQFTITGSKQPFVNGKVDYDLRSVRSSSPPASVEPSTAPHPKSYSEILAMIQRGEKPSNIREIDDSPPNPNQKPSNPLLAPRTKPWEVGQTQNNSFQVLQSQVNGGGLNARVQESTISSNGDTSVPWWQRKNIRITEIDNENELNAVPYVARSSEQPHTRTWVPPQPPSVALAEAAEAIRRPKLVVQKEQQADQSETVGSSGVSDELQRITKLSESGGATDINGESAALNSVEIQEQHEDRVEGN